MEIVFVPSATRDLEEIATWWTENRRDAPGLVTTELNEALERLANDATMLPIFRSVGDLVVRRLALPRTHRHVYFAVSRERVIVLAVWGSVRGILPRLRARASERS